MDEFEIELRISEVEKAYAVVTAAVNRARLRLQFLRADPTALAATVAQAQTRYDECERRRQKLRTTLDQLEQQTVPSVSTRPHAAHRPTLNVSHRRPR
jgi:hypothetical protein